MERRPGNPAGDPRGPGPGRRGAPPEPDGGATSGASPTPGSAGGCDPAGAPDPPAPLAAVPPAAGVGDPPGGPVGEPRPGALAGPGGFCRMALPARGVAAAGLEAPGPGSGAVPAHRLRPHRHRPGTAGGLAGRAARPAHAQGVPRPAGTGPAVRLPGPPAGPAERGLGLGGGHQQQRGGPGGAQPPEEAGAQSGPPPVHPDGPGGGLQTGLPPRRRGCRPGGSGPGVRGAALSQRFRSAARAGTLQGYRPACFFRPTRHLLAEGPGSRLESVGSTKRKGGTRAKGLSRHTTSRRWLVTAYKSDYPQTPELATSWILYKLHRPMTRLTSTSASHAKKPDAHPAAPGHSGSTTGPNSGGPRRFQCPGCGKVFTERLPGIRPWARQTEHAKAL